MRNFKPALAALICALAVASCGKSTKITGTVADAPQSEVIVKLLDVNRYQTLDTIKTNGSGAFSYALDVKKGEPEFIYLFHGNTRIASLLVESGEKVKVSADTLGNYNVSGSEGSEKLRSVEIAEAEFASKFAATSEKLAAAEGQEAARIRQDLGRQYLAYYRDRVVYIMQNSHSLSVIPVLYQRIGENLELFSQSTDAIHFQNAVDSLSSVYPKSKYVKALADEAKQRMSYLNLESSIANAEAVGFPELSLPDINGNKVALSSLKGKVVMLYFWGSESAEIKMFNIDQLKPIYDQYHSRGLDIYAVSLDIDKSAWAATVRNQKLDWVNVCDGQGAACPALGLYNVPSVPYIYIIKDGDIVNDAKITDEASLRRYLDSALK